MSLNTSKNQTNNVQIQKAPPLKIKVYKPSIKNNFQKIQNHHHTQKFQNNNNNHNFFLIKFSNKIFQKFTSKTQIKPHISILLFLQSHCTQDKHVLAHLLLKKFFWIFFFFFFFFPIKWADRNYLKKSKKFV
jgi:hypothetical protein